MKKILVLLSLLLLLAWLISFLTMEFTPVVHVFLLLSILLYIRSVMVVENSAGRIMPVSSPELEQAAGNTGKNRAL